MGVFILTTLAGRGVLFALAVAFLWVVKLGGV